MSLDDVTAGPVRAEPEVPLELAALAQRAGVDVRPDEWSFLLEAYGKTRAAIVRLSATLRPDDAPAFDPSPRESGETPAPGQDPRIRA